MGSCLVWGCWVYTIKQCYHRGGRAGGSEYRIVLETAKSLKQPIRIRQKHKALRTGQRGVWLGLSMLCVFSCVLWFLYAVLVAYPRINL